MGRLVLCDMFAFMPLEAKPIVQERIDAARQEGLPAMVDATLARWFKPLICLGTPVAAAQAIHERIAGSRLVVIPSASHLCNIEQAEVFNPNLVEFLSKADS